MNIQQKQLFPEGMWAFTGTPMQIRKTILRRPANHHTCVCTWWKQRLSVGWRAEELQFKLKKTADTRTVHVVLRENPRFSMTLWWDKRDPWVPSPSEACLMLQWMEAPRKTLQQHTLDWSFFLPLNKNKKRKGSWGPSMSLSLGVGWRRGEKKWDK